jgi:membrane fusion protein (multidrug efflux system)
VVAEVIPPASEVAEDVSPSQRRDAPPRRSPSLRVLLLWVVPAVVVLAGVAWFGSGGTVAMTDNAYVKQDRVDVTAQVSGDVQVVRVRENDRVTAGAAVLELDGSRLRADEQRALAGLANARLAVESMRAEYRAKAGEVRLARDTAQYATREYDRQRELVGRRLVTQTAVDEAHARADEATGRIGVLELQLAEARARLAGDPDVAVDAHPAVLAAAAELERVHVDLAHATVHAPRGGIVSRLPQVGDHVGEGEPAFAIVASDAVYVEANFKETDLGWVKPGQPVRIDVDLYPGREWRGRVQSVAQATGAEFSLLPAQNASGNWVKVVQRIPVRIALDVRPDDPPLRSGASATVAVETDAPTRMARWRARLVH